jgi:BASS family bile acid:Na+ symporter
MTVANFRGLVGVFGERALLGSLLFVAIGYGLGWICGGPEVGTRRIVGLGTAGRNIAAALVVAGQNFENPKVVVMVVVFTIVTVGVLFPLSHYLARRS